jgi:hypothetical protein
VATSATTALNGVAFQLAIWEIVNDNYVAGNTTALADGAFKATSSVVGAVTLANSWLAALGDIKTNTYGVNIWSVNGASSFGSGSQDVAVFAPIPEPETYGMLLAGLGLMGFVARRRRQDAV